MPQVECHIKARERQALDDFFQVAELGFLGTQKLAPRRCVEKQIPHLDGGAARVRSRPHTRRHVAPFGLYLPGLVRTLGARRQRQPRNRTDRGQRFTAKAQRGNSLEIIQITDLAGGMARQRQRQVILLDTRTIVAHPQQLDARLLNVDIDPFGTGVQAVFQQFLDNGGRPFNDLPCRDLVGQTRTKQLNTRHISVRSGPAHCRPAP